MWNNGTMPMGASTSSAFQSGTTGTAVPLSKLQKSNNDGLCDTVPLRGRVRARISVFNLDGAGSCENRPCELDEVAARTLAARYVSLAYDPDGRVKSRSSLKQADADLRHALPEIGVPSDRVEAEFQRVLNIVASDPNPGPKPD